LVLLWCLAEWGCVAVGADLPLENSGDRLRSLCGVRAHFGKNVDAEPTRFEVRHDSVGLFKMEPASKPFSVSAMELLGSSVDGTPSTVAHVVQDDGIAFDGEENAIHATPTAVEHLP
jgi:hypothetical protein